MRAFRGHEFGAIDRFGLEEVALPKPGAGELRIEVEATALGFVDQLVMRGLYQVKPALPFVPGGEIVGIIDAIGAGVEGFAIGQRVATWQYGGGLADRAIIEQRYTVAVPDTLDPADAAAILLDYLTAYYALFDRGSLRPGQSLLVTGASGGVGSAAVQLAKAAHASVIGLASGEAKMRHVAAIGVDLVLDYRDDDWRAQLKAKVAGGVDMVFDPVGGAVFEPCFRSLAKRGRHLVVGFAAGGTIANLPANLPLLKSGELIGVDARYLWDTDPARVREILTIVLDMAQARADCAGTRAKLRTGRRIRCVRRAGCARSHRQAHRSSLITIAWAARSHRETGIPRATPDDRCQRAARAAGVPVARMRSALRGRASSAPAQKCMPPPKLRCFFASRRMSNASGSSNTRGSRLPAPISVNTLGAGDDRLAAQFGVVQGGAIGRDQRTFIAQRLVDCAW